MPINCNVSEGNGNMATVHGEASYESLRPLMARFGAVGEPKAFYWAVNAAFHTAEAREYDSIHADMFDGLRPIWQRLTAALPSEPARLDILDVGAGTGLVAGFLQDLCHARVGKIVLLDPCQAMLERCQEKRSRWLFETQAILGDIEAVPFAAQFDVITVNSVLHHVVELEGFCSRLAALLRKGGVLLTAQDERAEAASDPRFLIRSAAARQRRKPTLYRKARGFAGRAIRRLLGKPNLGPLARATNQPLLEKGIIRRPMDQQNIWAVTDFHVPGQPGAFGRGISVRQLQAWLPGFELIDQLTYNYHGVPWTQLTTSERAEEQGWWASDDRSGQLLGTAWKKVV